MQGLQTVHCLGALVASLIKITTQVERARTVGAGQCAAPQRRYQGVSEPFLFIGAIAGG